MYVSTLGDKYKDLRRTPKKRKDKGSSNSVPSAPSTSKHKRHKPFELPPIPDGEDDTAEYSKASNTTMTANKLMDRTFLQRHWVPKIIKQMELEMKSRQSLSSVYDELMAHGMFELLLYFGALHIAVCICNRSHAIYIYTQNGMTALELCE